MPALPKALVPLRTPAYRWLFGSLVSSVLGSGLVVIAMFWQIVELGGGPGQVSFVLTATGLGLVATTLLGGALADRVPQKRILLAVELVNAAVLGLVAALAFAGALRVWQLAAASLLTGLAAGLYYPAYSAVLPSLLPAQDLLAANGIEGTLRPALMQAGGPAVAAALVATWSPAVALAGAALCALAAGAFVLGMPLTPVRREQVDDGTHPVRQVLVDVRDGFVYMARTPWLLATLVFASLMCLVFLGPFEVLGPFAIKDRAGGGPAEHAWVLAAFGIGGALGSLAMASLRLPRRYLTVMNLVWGLSCVPLVVLGTATSVWPMVAAAFVVGAGFQVGTVIWGTLLQRRVPPHLLGRVSSLDFFVSLAFMPVSMALAGPVSTAIGLQATFLVAGLVPPVIAVVAILWARLPADELAHPLDVPADPSEPVEQDASPSSKTS
ncbi:tetracycline efflux MFS transporter Tet(V) [Angustibacter speluncae]